MLYNDFGDMMIIRYIILNDSIVWEDISAYLPLLPAERCGKIARYRFEKDKLTSAVAGLMIRHMTGERELVYGEYKKPYVKDCDDLFFSVSHSGRCVAIAVDETEVGLDVEQIRTKDIEKFSRRFFSSGEQAYMDSSMDKPSAFTEIWTRKEAYLKCKGTGIAEDLTAFDTVSDELSECLHTVSLGDYILSVCSKKPLYLSDIQISKLELKEVLP